MKMSPGDVPALLGAYVDQEVAPKAGVESSNLFISTTGISGG